MLKLLWVICKAGMFVYITKTFAIQDNRVADSNSRLSLRVEQQKQAWNLTQTLKERVRT